MMGRGDTIHHPLRPNVTGPVTSKPVAGPVRAAVDGGRYFVDGFGTQTFPPVRSV